VESIIKRITHGQFWNFHGGIHPPEQKFLTKNKPIRTLSLPEQFILPLQQHIGQSGKLLVSVGDYVLKGQALTSSIHAMTVPIHAPTSGTVTAIKPSAIAHPSGLSGMCIFLASDGLDKWMKREVCQDHHSLTQQQIIDKILSAGIAGMGGAGFPTHIKVNSHKPINYLIINAAECEPYITADDLLIREQSASIFDGINILDTLLSPKHILIGIEDNKPEAIKVLQQVCKSNDKIKVCVLPTKYPTGGEKQLIQMLTGQEVPSGAITSKLGIVMQNIATCFAIADAVINDTPLIRRVVTVSGQALEKPQNVWALLGTPVSYLLKQCHLQKPINSNKDQNSSAKQQLIMGGPMMGFSLASDNVPIVKTTNCILAPSEQEIPTDNKEVECIRCGQCADACPAQLLPQELQWSAKAKDQQALEKLNLFDCIECGACAYVCPSQIPLVHYYRIAKSEIRQQQVQNLQAEKAKMRFEARKLRLEKEKLAREEKHKKAAEARKAKMAKNTPEASNAKSAVADALARVKAKKAQASGSKTEKTVILDNKDQAVDEKTDTVQTSNSPKANDKADKRSQVAAAIARAKAKKLAAKKTLVQDEPEQETLKQEETNKKVDAKNEQRITKAEAETENSKDTKTDKKAKIAATVAKAKAKKSAKASGNKQATTKKKEKEKKTSVKERENVMPKSLDNISQDNDLAIDDAKAEAEVEAEVEAETQSSKKIRIAAAIVKAKAKKASQTKQTKSKKNTSPKSNDGDDKKKRIAAAVAKAKAKKQQHGESN